MSLSRSSIGWRVAAGFSLAALLVAAHAGGLFDWASMANLKAHRASLSAFVETNRMLAALAFVVIYAALAALSFPAAGALTLTGGFLFGAPMGAALTVVAATAGAFIVFLIARALFGDRALDRLGARAAGVAAFLRAHAGPALLAIRLVPAFPFFLVNLVAAAVGVRARTYLITTFFGIIPVTYAIASAGAGLGRILDSGADASMLAMIGPETWALLIGLALLTLAAAPVKHVIETRFGAGREGPP